MENLERNGGGKDESRCHHPLPRHGSKLRPWRAEPRQQRPSPATSHLSRLSWTSIACKGAAGHLSANSSSAHQREQL
nr:hypothetical protein Itr_chr11CG16360 [Ipomoea trifida]